MQTRSKSALFLIELMIVVLFFSLTATVFVRVFVRSRQISLEADQLFHAQNEISNLAELLESGMDWQEAIESYTSFSEKTDDASVEIRYDSSWTPMEGDATGCRIEVKRLPATQEKLEEFTLRAIDDQGQEIYSLPLVRYRQ